LPVDAIVRTLREAGVPVAPVRSVADIADDPQLHHRGFFGQVEHPVMGEVTDYATGFKLSRTPTRFARSPLMGEHTWHVLRELLGLPDDQLAGLVGDGAAE
jgi:crotonobetainyl-CoA:carnitine CoA-transferase CaiB-like acyl-CoA transferase